MAKGRKTGGRGPGVRNKIGRELRESIHEVLRGNLSKFRQQLELLEGKEFVDAYAAYCKIVLPALKSVEMDARVEEVSSVTERLAALTEEELEDGC